MDIPDIKEKGGMFDMKILFIVDMDENNKSGLFIATHNRIKVLTNDFRDNKVEVFCLNMYDNRVLSLLKKFLKRKVVEKRESSFEYDGIFYKNIYIKNTILNMILSNFGLDSRQYRKVFKGINTEKYDVISAHWGHPQGSLAYHFNKNNSIPYTLTLHGSDIHTVPYKNKTFRRLVVRNMNNANAVFFVSQQLQRDAEKIGWDSTSQKGYVSYNAIDKKIFYPLSTHEIKIIKERENTKSKIVGFIGNLVPIKRAEHLIEIFKSIQFLIQESVTFYIIGKGLFKEFLIKSAEKEKIDIRIIDPVSQDELREYLNIMDCLILPSRNEGTPNIILESQSCGTPVVATNVGGVSEIIHNREYLVNNNDETLYLEFAKKVKIVLDKGERIGFESLSWKEIVKRELEVFESCIISK